MINMSKHMCECLCKALFSSVSMLGGARIKTNSIWKYTMFVLRKHYTTRFRLKNLGQCTNIIRMKQLITTK
jgi:hypothetical protein